MKRGNESRYLNLRLIVWSRLRESCKVLQSSNGCHSATTSPKLSSWLVMRDLNPGRKPRRMERAEFGSSCIVIACDPECRAPRIVPLVTRFRRLAWRAPGSKSLQHATNHYRDHGWVRSARQICGSNRCEPWELIHLVQGSSGCKAMCSRNAARTISES